MPITYEAKSRQDRWISGSGVTIDLRVDNHTAAPFEMPDPMYRTSTQPRFELTSPGGGRKEFSPNSLATDWDRRQPPSTVRVAPGGHWEGDLSLALFADVGEPGRYRLRSWIESQGARIESAPVEFEVIRPATRDLAAETSAAEPNLTVVDCVELLDGGIVAASNLAEEDARNAELLPFERMERGATDPEADAIFAPYSNFSVGMTGLRWIVAAKQRRLVVGHNLHPGRVQAFEGAPLSLILPPVATEAGLYVAGVRGGELVLSRVTGSESGIAAGPVWVVEKLASAPVSAALTLSPQAAGNTLLFMLAWNLETETRVQFLTVNPAGKVLARAEHKIHGVRPLGPAAAGWSTAGEVRASLLVRNANVATELRAAEIHLSPVLAIDGAARFSEPVRLEFPLEDARFSYFESQPGRLSRMIVIRTSGDKVWVISSGEAPRAPRRRLPARGPLAILPGQAHWYAVWPDAGKLAIAPL